ncbi:MAG: flagellin FliC [Bdellovibrionales bacterium]|nr:flagellin FliC [Bdellovibrionales bacterium]NQZ18850.1 flagellin FliC [Bdellovibrionales bacterium]
MALRIATNVPSITAQRSMNASQRMANKAMAQLSTGSRITKAADDAAGLSISENLNSNIRSYKQAGRNTHDGISLVQVAEGALGEVSNIITRFRELSIQAASDTIGDQERSFIQAEVEQMKSEVERIAQSTQFGDKKLLNGEGDTFDFQVGINADPELNAISFDSSEADATLGTLGLSGLDISSKEGAQDALDSIDEAQTIVNGYRANLGGLQNRLTTTTENVDSAVENLSAAKSRMMDADIAQSSAELTKNNILLNATTSVLSQANASPQMALKLVG